MNLIEKMLTMEWPVTESLIFANRELVFHFFFFFFGECKQIKKSEKPFSKQRKQVEIV